MPPISIPTPTPPTVPLWLSQPAANTDLPLTALELAKRMGWRGIATEAVLPTAARSIGSVLWGALRIGLPVLTLGLVMEGDASRKPASVGDFPHPKPDSRFTKEWDLAFLKQQKTLAELSGNESLAIILNLHILRLEFQLAAAGAQRAAAPLRGRPIHILASVGGNSMPVRRTLSIDLETLSEDDQFLWEALKARYRISARAVYRFLVDRKLSPDHVLLDKFVAYHHNDPSATHAIALYRMYRVMDGAPQYGTMFHGVNHFAPHSLVKDVASSHIHWLWDVLLTTVLRRKDATTRRYALQITQHAMKMANHQVSSFRSIMEAGLQDPDPLNVWLTWQIFHHYMPVEACAVADCDLDSPAQLDVSSSPSFGLAKYLHGTDAQIHMRYEIFMTILGSCDVEEDLLSWKQFQPIHSLADFNPDPDERKATMHDKQVLLVKLAKQFRWDSEMTLHEFLIGDPLANDDAVKVIVLQSGQSYLAQGHHRIAALIDLAHRGIIPMTWLKQLPVYVMRYDGDVPEVIVRRVLTLGIDMHWPELFPPSTLQK